MTHSHQLSGAGHTPIADPELVLSQAVLCADGIPRCPWALSNPVTLSDHDTRWGQQPTTPSRWFEALCLEIFQSGLPQATALGRHAALKQALYDFHPRQVALFSDDDIDDLLLDRTMIRNRPKLVAVVTAARITQDWEDHQWQECVAVGSLASSQAAHHLAQRFRELGISHVGDAIAHHFLNRVGALPAHTPGCYRYRR